VHTNKWSDKQTKIVLLLVTIARDIKQSNTQLSSYKKTQTYVHILPLTRHGHMFIYYL
jgi:hypothetical protein